LGFKEFMRRLLVASLFLLKNGFIRRKISFQNLLELDFHFYHHRKYEFSNCF
jgi:hypothetical protein